MADELNRRGFLGALGAGGVVLATGLPAEASGRALSTVYIGGYTDSGGPGLQVGSVDPTSGKLTVASTVKGVRNPSWYAFSADRKVLYSTNENTPGGAVSAFGLADPTKPKLLNTVQTKGTGTTHVSVHPSGKYLLAANYDSGSVSVLAVKADGSIGAVTDHVKHTGTRDDAHAHQTVTDPSGKWIVSVDLGADSVYVYSLNLTTGKLTQKQQLKLPSGAGPRHLAFNPNGRYAYILGELRSEITVVAWDPTAGKLTPGQVIGTLPGGTTVENFPGEIQISGDGRYVYTSNRGHDSLATFTTNETGDKLTFVTTTPTGGKYPRHFTLDPSGNWVYASNQNSNLLTWLPRDPATGKLSPSVGSVSVKAVAVVAFR